MKYYLSTLQSRQKLQKDRKKLSNGEVVMIIEPQLVGSLWTIGRVTKINTGDDQCMRSAVVQVGDRQYLQLLSRLETASTCSCCPGWRPPVPAAVVQVGDRQYLQLLSRLETASTCSCCPGWRPPVPAAVVQVGDRQYLQLLSRLETASTCSCCPGWRPPVPAAVVQVGDRQYLQLLSELIRLPEMVD
ncbi:uncharacterized protein LOC124260186 [Haliotis rubra]|uniref:uncharacterized protein LOC124260186 n=1 Tax=Haliotis rubra TaxID=36100 RepID=UPI001EE5D5DB|nr:uncharacterized protein LOC124260186 [Haliotis rubra]